MDISVEHLSRLARLSLTEDEKERFGGQLSDILKYVETLNELDTRNAEPTSHVIDLRNVTREDEPRESLPRDEALMNAPDGTERFYRVPKIIE